MAESLFDHLARQAREKAKMPEEREKAEKLRKKREEEETKRRQRGRGADYHNQQRKGILNNLSRKK
jgi:hypothetical protein